MQKSLQVKFDALNREIQNKISEFAKANGLNDFDVIVEIDNSYPCGQFSTPTRYGLFIEQNKGGYRTMSISLAPGKPYESQEILKIYREAIGREVALPF